MSDSVNTLATPWVLVIVLVAILAITLVLLLVLWLGWRRSRYDRPVGPARARMSRHYEVELSSMNGPSRFDNTGFSPVEPTATYRQADSKKRVRW